MLRGLIGRRYVRVTYAQIPMYAGVHIRVDIAQKEVDVFTVQKRSLHIDTYIQIY